MLKTNVAQDIKLSDVIDLEFLQQFQDVFAKALGVASIIVDDSGPVTKPSNFSDFCINYVRNHPEGFKRCNQCDIQGGIKSFECGKPVIYHCHAGLLDFAAPIIVDGKQIASMLGGQVLTAKPDISKFEDIFRILGSDVEHAIRDALDKINILPEEKLSAAAELMYIVANALSKIGYQNLKIRQSSKEIEMILNCMPDGVVTIGYDGVISFCNTTLENMFGYKSSDIIGKSPDSLFEEGEDLFSNIENMSHSTYETKGIKKDGTDFWIEINASEMCIGPACSKIISIRDISKRKELEQEVENSKVQAITILKNLPFMAWLKDTEGKFIAVNEQFSELCKLPFKEILGKTDMDLFPKEMAQGYMKCDQNIIKTKKPKVIEEQIISPDGIKWIETFKVPIIGSTGEVIGTTGYAIDVTERRSFNKSRNEFMSIISQELRTQLNAIRGALVVISDGLNSTLCSSTKELIDLANVNNARLINMINDIIDIEKIETRSADYNIQLYDLRMLIEQVLDSKEFDVGFEFENFDAQASVKVDKARLKQVLGYLLSIAATCSIDNNPVIISLNRSEGYVGLAIKSFGHSIPQASKESLFRKFSEIELPNNQKTVSTGLEFSLCKAVVESFDGIIDFENIPDGGIIFRIDIPEAGYKV
jgi:PAS domain S-box-containing protein